MLEVLASTIRMSSPLIFAAMGGLLCERAGIATICLEGVMLFSALASATAALWLDNPWWGLATGLVIGAVSMSLHSFLTVTAKSDRIISGVAVNILAAGITPLLCKFWFTSATNTASLDLADRLPGKPILALALILPLLVHFFLYKTKWGNWIYAAGDGPEALNTSGINLKKVRYFALALGGMLTAFGGIYMAISHGSNFTRDMTAGRGFIALAALIFGKWKPIPTFLACLFFGFTDAIQIQLQSATFGDFQVPIQLIQALPYLVTLLVLVGFVGQSRPPSAIITGE